MENGKWQKGQRGDGAGGKSHEIPVRAFEFGTRIIRLCCFLYGQRNVPRRLTDQLAGCGTSIGANVEEGQAAQSRADFIAKYSIALKEARESAYRLKLFLASDVLTPKQAGDLKSEAEQLAAMIAQAIITARRNGEDQSGEL